VQSLEAQKRLRERRGEIQRVSLGAAVARQQHIAAARGGAEAGAGGDSADAAMRELMESTQIEARPFRPTEQCVAHSAQRCQLRWVEQMRTALGVV
jgi:hypothetical protein